MNPIQSKPSYLCSPIRSKASLSRALGVPITVLEQLALVANQKYRLAKPIPKPDGTFRQPFDALPPLKDIHRRLKIRVFEKVRFPDYLTGSLKGKDAIKNAALHAGAAIVISEDIKDFYPSISTSVVQSIWARFFRFSPDVAELLAVLCTKDGALPQGAIPSSYLANLAFWDREWKLYERFRERGIAYSRYVDDVTLSSKIPLANEDLTQCISSVYGLMSSKGLRPKRKKQEIHRGHASMIATKLVVNRRPALPTQERQAIRAAVHQLELQCCTLTDISSLTETLNRVAGRVGRLALLHPNEGSKLKQRISLIRLAITASRG